VVAAFRDDALEAPPPILRGQADFDDKNALGHVATLAFSVRIRSSNWKVAPLPSVDSTQMRPPCISTIRLAMENPSPVPPLALVLELSTRWNCSKMRACSFGVPHRPYRPAADETVRYTAPASSAQRSVFPWCSQARFGVGPGVPGAPQPVATGRHRPRSTFRRVLLREPHAGGVSGGGNGSLVSPVLWSRRS
jgi:hypothetical protein